MTRVLLLLSLIESGSLIDDVRSARYELSANVDLGVVDLLGAKLLMPVSILSNF